MTARVYLVGAGPGAVDLLTLRAVRILASADVVLFDALVESDVLAYTRSGTRLVDVGKRSGKSGFTQSEINSLLVDFAQGANIVVRLKGGDPLVFGRAAEEIDTLVAAGFEIVPGVTAACTAAAARISLTDRRNSSAVVLATATHSEGNRERGLADTEYTHVIYMPGRDYSLVHRQLRRAGVAACTPCLVISRISSPEQQVFRTTVAALETVPALPAPSILIVGEVARQNQTRESCDIARVPSQASFSTVAEYES